MEALIAAIIIAIIGITGLLWMGPRTQRNLDDKNDVSK